MTHVHRPGRNAVRGKRSPVAAFEAWMIGECAHQMRRCAQPDLVADDAIGVRPLRRPAKG